MVCTCIKKVQSLCLRLKLACRRRGRGGRAKSKGNIKISDPFDVKHLPLDIPEGIYQDEPQSVRDTNLLVNRRISALREKGISRASSFVVVDVDSPSHYHRRPSSSTHLAPPDSLGIRSISLNNTHPSSPSSTNTLNISNTNLQHKRVTHYRSTGSLRTATPLALGTVNRSTSIHSAMSAATLPTYLTSPSPPSQPQSPTMTSCYYLNGYSNKSTHNFIIGRPRPRSRVSASRVPTLSSAANASFGAPMTTTTSHSSSSMTASSSSSPPPPSFYGYRASPSAANGGRGLACNNPGGMVVLPESPRSSVSRSFAAIDDITAATRAAALANARSGSMSTSITTSSTLSSFVDAEGRKVFPM